MYNTNAFRNFLSVQAKTYGDQYRSYGEEFVDHTDAELLKELENCAGQLRHHDDDLNSDLFNHYFGEICRMVECLKLRQEFQQEVSEDEGEE